MERSEIKKLFKPCEETDKYFELLVESDVGEKHHILPRSIYPEHASEKWNLIRLSYTNHYKVHELLPYMVEGAGKYKMLCAWNLICGITKGKFVDVDRYVELKLQHVEMCSGENNVCFNRVGDKHPLFGKSHSQETKDKMRKSHENESEETRRRKSESRKGKKHEQYVKDKIAASRIGKPRPKHVTDALILAISRKVTINNIQYSSILEASRVLGISRSKIYSGIAKGEYFA